jgi:hypothetical protein
MGRILSTDAADSLDVNLMNRVSFNKERGGGSAMATALRGFLADIT